MIEEITARRDQLLRELSAIDNRTDLEDFERESVGKRSPLIAWRESIKTLQPEQRPVIGKALNEFRDSLVAAIAESSERLSEAEQDSRPMLDLTLPSRGRRRGTLHLVTQVMRELEDIFVSMGYSIAEGPEVETDWYNFEALNFPKGHPARDARHVVCRSRRTRTGASENAYLARANSCNGVNSSADLFDHAGARVSP